MAQDTVAVTPGEVFLREHKDQGALRSASELRVQVSQEALGPAFVGVKKLACHLHRTAPRLDRFVRVLVSYLLFRTAVVFPTCLGCDLAATTATPRAGPRRDVRRARV